VPSKPLNESVATSLLFILNKYLKELDVFMGNPGFVQTYLNIQ
jgi:hypothetical protein